MIMKKREKRGLFTGDNAAIIIASSPSHLFVLSTHPLSYFLLLVSDLSVCWLLSVRQIPTSNAPPTGPPNSASPFPRLLSRAEQKRHAAVAPVCDRAYLTTAHLARTTLSAGRDRQNRTENLEQRIKPDFIIVNFRWT